MLVVTGWKRPIDPLLTRYCVRERRRWRYTKRTLDLENKNRKSVSEIHMKENRRIERAYVGFTQVRPSTYQTGPPIPFPLM